MLKAVIFDCFGVLVGRGFEHTYRLAGGDPVADKDFVADILGKTNLGMIDDRTFDQAVARQLGISYNQWLDVCAEAEQPDKTLLAYIAKLRQTYKTAVLSNANKGTLQSVLGDEVLEQMFDEIIVSAQVGFAKPDPRIYQHAADKLGLSPQDCIFIDDQPSFLPPAETLGMHTLLCLDPEQVVADLEQLLN